MLGELCEEVHVEVFREQSTPLDQLNLALADVRKQGFVVEEDIGKASTSPDRRHRALLKHIVTGDRCEVVVIVSDTKKRKIVEALLLTKQPSFCFTVPKDKALLEWISNNTVKAGPARIQVHCR